MHDHIPTPTETKTIPLSQGLVAIVDAADYEWLSQWKWHAYRHNNVFYVTRNVPLPDGGRTSMSMHREILNAAPGVPIDHRDGDGLNNTRSNLRICTNSQNIGNSRVRNDNSSGYKGVSWFRGTGKWRAYIQARGKWKHIGYYSTPEDAAHAYDKAAIELHGEFARLNFP